MEAFRLDGSSVDHLLAHLAAAEPGCPFRKFLKGHRRHLDLDIDSIEKRAPTVGNSPQQRFPGFSANHSMG